jgi:hypothetical protein
LRTSPREARRSPCKSIKHGINRGSECDAIGCWCIRCQLLEDHPNWKWSLYEPTRGWMARRRRMYLRCGGFNSSRLERWGEYLIDWDDSLSDALEEMLCRSFFVVPLNKTTKNSWNILSWIFSPGLSRMRRGTFYPSTSFSHPSPVVVV